MATAQELAMNIVEGTIKYEAIELLARALVILKSDQWLGFTNHNLKEVKAVTGEVGDISAEDFRDALIAQIIAKFETLGLVTLTYEEGSPITDED